MYPILLKELKKNRINTTTFGAEECVHSKTAKGVLNGFLKFDYG